MGPRGRGLVSVFVLALALCPRALATTTQLPFSDIGQMVLDPAHAHVFVTGGQDGSSVVILNYDGSIAKTITSEQGASGMALDGGTGTLYVALRNVSAISKISTATLTETGRFTTTGMSAPRWVALAGGRVWFSFDCFNSGGVGSAAVNGTDLQTELGTASSCDRFATTPTDTNMLASSDGDAVHLYDVSSGSPVQTHYEFSPGGAGNIKDLRFSPEGTDLFIAAAGPYSIQSFSVPDFTLSGSYLIGPYPDALALTTDAAYLAGGADAYYNPDVFVFDATSEEEIRHWDFGEGYVLLPGGLAFTPDASRLFAVTKNPATGKVDFRVLGSPTLPAADTSTSIQASVSTVTYGNSLSLKAHVTGAASGLVSFFALPYGGGKTVIKTVAINQYGNASILVKPALKTWYSAEYAGDAAHDGSISTDLLVRVRARVRVALSGFYARSGAYKLYHLGRTPTVRGTVAPNHAGNPLTFVAQRYRLGAWRSQATATFTIPAGGSAYAVLRNTSIGRYRVRVVFSGDLDHLGNKSVWAYLKVTS